MAPISRFQFFSLQHHFEEYVQFSLLISQPNPESDDSSTICCCARKGRSTFTRIIREEKITMIGKPSYNPSKRVYICEIEDGLRFSKEVSSNEPTLDQTDELKNTLVDIILKETKQYFAKPVSESEIRTKLHVQSNPPFSPDPSPMLYTMGFSSLEISQTKFLCIFTVVSKTPIQSTPTIEFLDQDLELVEEPVLLESMPIDNTEPISIRNSRLRAKQRIRRARLRAAKAILRSEQLTKEFVEKWGEPESDWESDSTDDESSFDSE